MFVGHYGPSFLGKAIQKSIPLWQLFLAVQLLDVIWSVFVLLGIEKVRIVPGITASNPLDLYYMPYTHGLDTALFWSILAALSFRVLRQADWHASVVIGAAVFSHWLLDLIVHRPDLPLYDDTRKVGLGLWNFPIVAFALESAFLFGGMYVYMKQAGRAARSSAPAFLIFGMAMLAIQAFVFFGPPPSSDRAPAVTALIAYAAFAGIAYRLEARSG